MSACANKGREVWARDRDHAVGRGGPLFAAVGICRLGKHGYVL